MFTAYVVVTLVAIAANAFSGIAALIHWKQILPGMAKAGVPESWLTTLGALKTAAAIGLLLGLIGVPLIGTTAAIGLVLFFVGADRHPPARTRLLAAVRPGDRVLPAHRGRPCVGTRLVGCGQMAPRKRRRSGLRRRSGCRRKDVKNLVTVRTIESPA
jgi:hypothetical protein